MWDEAVENKRYKILLVEDDKLDQMAFMRLVKEESLPYDYAIAGSVSEAQSILGADKFDIVIADYSLGDGTAFDIFTLVKDTPIIVITGAGDEEIAVRAMKADAYDYLIKDIEQNYLKTVPITVENAIRHKKLEKILDQKQKNLEAIFDAVPVGMLLVDENMIVKRANNAIKQMVHRQYSQIINRRVGGALCCVNSTCNEKGCGYGPACEVCSLQKMVESVLYSGQSVHGLEIQPSLRVNSTRITPWFRISAEPAIIDRYKHVVITIDDITERKKVEGTLLIHSEVMTNMSEGVNLIRASDGAIVYANPKFEEMFGYGPGELLGKHISVVNAPTEKSPEETAKEIIKHLNEKGAWQGEILNVRKDGRSFWCYASVSMFDHPEHGKVCVSMNTDITERRRSEEKLKETMEMKSQFISTVSHELRTPLTCMKESVAVLLDGAAGAINDKQRNFLDIAKRNIDRLAMLINDVLDFQRLEANKMELNMQENDIKEVVEEVHRIMVSSARKKGLDFSLKLAGDLPKATFDADKIIQVLTNLVGNAIKFTPKKGQVSVCVQHQGEELVISVSDTGIGIPKEALTKIFERFYSVHQPGKQIQGTGLGLAIVKKVVMMHGGRIGVESEVAKGTTFTVFLPLIAKSMPETLPAKMDEILENSLTND